MSSEIHDRIYEQVCSMVQRQTGRKRIEQTSKLYHDLGVDGEDGYHLIATFQKQFQVDMDAFVFERHFGPEVPFKHECMDLSPFVRKRIHQP